jgi:hypothetical protein
MSTAMMVTMATAKLLTLIMVAIGAYSAGDHLVVYRDEHVRSRDRIVCQDSS